MKLSAVDQALREDRAALWVARVVGAVFVPAGLVKFVAYGWELDAFERFGLPVAAAWVIAAGLVEVGGAISLLAVRGVAVFVPLLIVTMAVAVGVSGVAAGDVIPSLTLAPLLLAGLLFIAWRLREALSERRELTRQA
jgi:uncharacterized membrane protein YphA (DoxX/SURF4 family)